jgi:putative IMPACT (imprinted ancient) family translation regulator
MTASDTYKTIRTISGGLYKEKGSRFVAAAYPVTNETEIKGILEENGKEHHEARHHCLYNRKRVC